MATGWRKQLSDVVTAIRGTLADAALAGSMSAADFLKLAGLPTSAVPTTRNIGTTLPLTGGGDLSADRTLAINAATAVAPGSLAAADFAKLATAPSSSVLELAWFLGTDVDLTATGQTAVTPAAPAGKLFIPTKLFSIVTAVAGAISTPPTASWGNNGSWNNALTSGTVSAPAVAFNAGVGATTGLNPFGAGGSNSTAAYSINISTGATGTGGFAYRAKFGMAGFYVTFP